MNRESLSATMTLYPPQDSTCLAVPALLLLTLPSYPDPSGRATTTV